MPTIIMALTADTVDEAAAVEVVEEIGPAIKANSTIRITRRSRILSSYSAVSGRVRPCPRSGPTASTGRRAHANSSRSERLGTPRTADVVASAFNIEDAEMGARPITGNIPTASLFT